MSKDDVTFDSVSELLVKELPELNDAYRAELDWWGGERPGQYIVYEGIFYPYVVELLQTKGWRRFWPGWPFADTNTDCLRRAFSLIEKLSVSPDTRVKDLVVISICARICWDKIAMRRARNFMGAATKKHCEAWRNWSPKV